MSTIDNVHYRLGTPPQMAVPSNGIAIATICSKSTGLGTPVYMRLHTPCMVSTAGVLKCIPHHIIAPLLLVGCYTRGL